MAVLLELMVRLSLNKSAHLINAGDPGSNTSLIKDFENYVFLFVLQKFGTSEFKVHPTGQMIVLSQDSISV